MNNRKKALLSLALCGLLALGIAIPAFGASGTVYLMAVNDRVLAVTAENMPTVMGGVLYVPYTMLSTQITGINLGINALYSPIKRTVLVSDGQMGILFDLQANTAQDQQGNPVSARAMVRNSTIFVPIDFLCGYFGTISCSRVYSRYGTVVRVTSRAARLRNQDFVDAAENNLADSLRGYYASIEPPETAEPTAPPMGPTTPPPGPTTTPPGTTPPQPSTPPVEAEVLLALRWGERVGELARLLEDRGERALFLFTAEELREQDDTVRRLVAAGHTVGLVLTGEDTEMCMAQVEEGRRLMGAVARYYALVVSAAALDDEGREALRQKGCAVWSPDFRGEDYRSGEALAEALASRQVCQVELECGGESTAFLRAMLDAMDGEGCTLRQATASLL